MTHSSSSFVLEDETGMVIPEDDHGHPAEFESLLSFVGVLKNLSTTSWRSLTVEYSAETNGESPFPSSTPNNFKNDCIHALTVLITPPTSGQC